MGWMAPLAKFWICLEEMKIRSVQGNSTDLCWVSGLIKSFPKFCEQINKTPFVSQLRSANLSLLFSLLLSGKDSEQKIPLFMREEVLFH